MELASNNFRSSLLDEVKSFIKGSSVVGRVNVYGKSVSYSRREGKRRLQIIVSFDKVYTITIERFLTGLKSQKLFSTETHVFTCELETVDKLKEMKNEIR